MKYNRSFATDVADKEYKAGIIRDMARANRCSKMLNGLPYDDPLYNISGCTLNLYVPLGTSDARCEKAIELAKRKIDVVNCQVIHCPDSWFSEAGLVIEPEKIKEKTRSNLYGYYINLDERGEFFADVRDEDLETIFEIHGFDLFEDGVMKEKTDMVGLREHLQDLMMIKPQDQLLLSADFEEATRPEQEFTYNVVNQVVVRAKTELEASEIMDQFSDLLTVSSHALEGFNGEIENGQVTSAELLRVVKMKNSSPVASSAPRG
jgi:hypothetical protein